MISRPPQLSHRLQTPEGPITRLDLVSVLTVVAIALGLALALFVIVAKSPVQ